MSVFILTSTADLVELCDGLLKLKLQLLLTVHRHCRRRYTR